MWFDCYGLYENAGYGVLMSKPLQIYKNASFCRNHKFWGCRHCSSVIILGAISLADFIFMALFLSYEFLTCTTKNAMFGKCIRTYNKQDFVKFFWDCICTLHSFDWAIKNPGNLKIQWCWTKSCSSLWIMFSVFFLLILCLIACQLIAG